MVKYLLAGDPGSIPGLERSPGEGNDSPLQYSCLENSMDRPWGHEESDMTEGQTLWASLVAQTVKNPPAMQGTWVQSLGWEEGMATLVFWSGKSPWTKDPGVLQSMGSQRV